jgi:DNA-binding IscR family transcriptional regulator
VLRFLQSKNKISTNFLRENIIRPLEVLGLIKRRKGQGGVGILLEL